MTDTQTGLLDDATRVGGAVRAPRVHSRKAVVVGVDGSERNRAAVAWAMQEAETTARPLNLVSVLNDHGVPVTHHSAPTESDRDRNVLRRFAAYVARESPEMAVSYDLEADGTVSALLARSVDQDLLVVGKRGQGTFGRILIGSTSLAVAGRSRVPVVIVPDSWTQHRHAHEPVVLGVDPDDLHPEALIHALKEAQGRGVGLVVVHGWAAEAVLDRDPRGCADMACRHGQGPGRLAASIRSFRAEYDDVRVELVECHDHPATALLAATRTAQLLVLGRHDDGRRGGFAFGSVTRAVLHHALVPVAVVPSDRPRSRP